MFETLFSGNIFNKQLHLMKYEIEKRKIMLSIRKKKDWRKKSINYLHITEQQKFEKIHLPVDENCNNLHLENILNFINISPKFTDH